MHHFLENKKQIKIIIIFPFKKKKTKEKIFTCILFFFFLKTKSKIQNLLLKKYEIILYNRSSHILGLVLYFDTKKLLSKRDSIIAT